jgi:hypothetical protein
VNLSRCRAGAPLGILRSQLPSDSRQAGYCSLPGRSSEKRYPTGLITPRLGLGFDRWTALCSQFRSEACALPDYPSEGDLAGPAEAPVANLGWANSKPCLS